MVTKGPADKSRTFNPASPIAAHQPKEPCLMGVRRALIT
jgi:hypothetical protein